MKSDFRAIRAIRAMLSYVQDGVASADERGLDEDKAVASVDLSAYKEKSAGDDPVVRYYFDEYFADPNVRRTYAAMTE